MSCFRHRPKYQQLFLQSFQKEKKQVTIRFRNLNRLIEYATFNADQVQNICILFQEKILKADKKQQISKIKTISQGLSIFLNSVPSISVGAKKELVLLFINLSTIRYSLDVVSVTAKMFLPQQDFKLLFEKILTDLQKLEVSLDDFKLRFQYYEICYFIEQKLIEDNMALQLFTEMVLFSSSIMQSQFCSVKFLPLLVKFIKLYYSLDSLQIISFFPLILEKFVLCASENEQWQKYFQIIVRNVQKNLNVQVKRSQKVSKSALEASIQLYYQIIVYLPQTTTIYLYKNALQMTLLDDIVFQTITKRYLQANLVFQYEIIKKLPSDFIQYKTNKHLKQFLKEILISRNSLELIIQFVQRTLIVDNDKSLQNLMMDSIQISLQSYHLPKRQTRLYKSVLAFSNYIDFDQNFQSFFQEISSIKGNDWLLLYNQYQDFLPFNLLEILLFYIKLLPLFGYEKFGNLENQILQFIPQDQQKLPMGFNPSWDDIKQDVKSSQTKLQMQNWWERLINNFQ